MDALEITRQVTDLAQVADEKIVSQSDLDHAAASLSACKGLIRKIEGYFAPLKQGAYDSWKRICAQEKQELDKLKPIAAVLDRKIIDYRMEQDRIRREAEEKARRQEEERRRLEEKALRDAEEAARRAEAEKRRIEEEARLKESRARSEAAAAKAREEAARRQAEIDRQAKEAQDRILEKAAAEEKKLEPVAVVPQKAVSNGTVIVHNWKYRVVDINQVPREYLCVNDTYTGKMVRASEGKLRIPGIEIYDEPYTRTR